MATTVPGKCSTFPRKVRVAEGAQIEIERGAREIRTGSTAAETGWPPAPSTSVARSSTAGDPKRLTMDPGLPNMPASFGAGLPRGQSKNECNQRVRGMGMTALRHDWTIAEVEALFALPFADLMFRAQETHRANHQPNAVQMSTLLSIKTGACPEDCAYCPQSVRYDTGLEREKLVPLDEVRSRALAAKEAGATRFCMGAAWRSPKKRDVEAVSAMIREVRALGMETCATLGMLTPEQAHELKDAGLDYYNHNVDTSPEFYGEIITTRTYQDRLDTLAAVRDAGLNVCCGGIVGMGETVRDRASMLATLANLPQHPESVPINQLVRVPGTPLAGKEPVDPFDFVRTIAVARVVMPKAFVRLSAGREAMADELQALCFLAGANSIFYGEKLLTTGNPDVARDRALLTRLGIEPLVPPALAAAAERAHDEPAGHVHGPHCEHKGSHAAPRPVVFMRHDPAALKTALADLEQRHLRRTRRVELRAGVINFCSNDYLGLAKHPAVVGAFQDAAAKYGVGSGASHLVTGHGPEHEALEDGAGGLHRPRKGAGLFHRLHGQYGRHWSAGGSKRRSGLRQAQSCITDRRLPALGGAVPALPPRRRRACVRAARGARFRDRYPAADHRRRVQHGRRSGAAARTGARGPRRPARG